MKVSLSKAERYFTLEDVSESTLREVVDLLGREDLPKGAKEFYITIRDMIKAEKSQRSKPKEEMKFDLRNASDIVEQLEHPFGIYFNNTIIPHSKNKKGWKTLNIYNFLKDADFLGVELEEKIQISKEILDSSDSHMYSFSCGPQEQIMFYNEEEDEKRFINKTEAHNLYAYVHAITFTGGMKVESNYITSTSKLCLYQVGLKDAALHEEIVIMKKDNWHISLTLLEVIMFILFFNEI